LIAHLRPSTHGAGRICLALVAGLLICNDAWAKKPKVARRDRECGDLAGIPGVVWAGSDPIMTLQDLASYCGPILEFSPDEPLLADAHGKDIRMTAHFPFEDDPGAPVLYYRIDGVAARLDAKESALSHTDGPKGDIQIDLSKVNAVDLRFCLYYPSEEGLGGHQHDLEVVDMKVFVAQWDEWQDKPCDRYKYVICVMRVIGRAHGQQWYDNHLVVDEYARFPMGVLVEEGKHANCPDKNLDGMYTPGFDVNVRVNDAWGVRDIIRGGALFTGGFESWMNKTRQKEDRVFPPLPEDSWVKKDHTVRGVYAPNNAIYVLRPLPRKEQAEPDAHLAHYIESKGTPEWPLEHPDTDIHKLGGWVRQESFAKSLSIAYRWDGQAGLSFAFPFFIVKHLEDPMTGGWIVQRMYLKDKHMRDFGWMALYAPSASRWMDGYLSAGIEWDTQDLPDDFGGYRQKTEHNFVFESGIKFRVNMVYSPIKFVTKITDFWGVRVGLKYSGNAWDFRHVGFLAEVGAGTF
jgi:hypothetical protein